MYVGRKEPAMNIELLVIQQSFSVPMLCFSSFPLSRWITYLLLGKQYIYRGRFVYFLPFLSLSASCEKHDPSYFHDFGREHAPQVLSLLDWEIRLPNLALGWVCISSCKITRTARMVLEAWSSPIRNVLWVGDQDRRFTLDEYSL